MNEIRETKTPNAGEWWVSDSGLIAFVVGIAIDGDPVWQQNGSRQIMSDQLEFFLACFNYEPRCTGFDWVEPVSIDPGESYEFLAEGTVLRPGDEVRHSGGTWLPTGHPGECVGSKPWVRNLYRRKIDPVAEVWPKFYAPVIPSSHYYRIDSSDIAWCISSDEETVGADAERLMCSPDVWLEVTESEALARVAVYPDDISLNPVPGKVVATGTVTLKPVQRENWKIRCLRRDLPVAVPIFDPETFTSDWGPFPSDVQRKEQPAVKRVPVQPDIDPGEVSEVAAIIAEHTQQVRELTQRIGDLVQQVNQRDAVIEGMRTLLGTGFSYTSS